MTKQNKQTDKKKQPEQKATQPIIQEIPCYRCNSFLLDVVGMFHSGEFLMRCKSCGTINSLMLDVPKKESPTEPPSKIHRSYLG